MKPGQDQADKVSSEELLIEINELRKQNGLMKEQLAAIEPSIFTGSEEKDFSYIYNQLNRFEETGLEIIEYEEVTLGGLRNSQLSGIVKHDKYSINLVSLIPFVSSSKNHEYRWGEITYIILSQIFPNLSSESKNTYSITEIKNLADSLIIYGFITKSYRPPKDSAFPIMLSSNYKLIYSEKLERFKYWLNVNGKMPERIQILKKE